MKKKQSTLKDILFISISSFIVVGAWVGFNIYHSYVTTTITPELQVQIVPINPNFDTATIENLKTRKQVVPVSELANTVVEPTKTPTTTQTNTAITPAQALPTQAQQIENDIPVTVQGQ